MRQQNKKGKQRKCETKEKYIIFIVRIEEVIREFQGNIWDAVFLNEAWRPAKSEILETHQRHISMGAGQYENIHGVGILMNNKMANDNQ